MPTQLIFYPRLLDACCYQLAACKIATKLLFTRGTTSNKLIMNV